MEALKVQQDVHIVIRRACVGAALRRWSLAATAGLTAAAIAALAVQPSIALASVNANWGTGIAAMLPNNAVSPEAADLTNVSCSSPGNCTAIGSYTDSSGDAEGLLVSETSGTWGPGVEAPLPAGASSDPNVSITSVSCAAAGDCTAVGSYWDSPTHQQQGLLLTEASGVWATGVEASLPANAGASPEVSLTSVSCVLPGSCTAVGQYSDSSGDEHALVLTQTSDAWATGVEPGYPANAGAQPEAQLYSVSCVSAGNCSAIGRYFDGSGDNHVLGLTETAGEWGTGVEAALPANAVQAAFVQLNQVSCGSAGNCTAVGLYIDTSSNPQGMLFNENAGVWSPGVEASVPASAGTASKGALLAVSCVAAGSCTATGLYTDSSDNDHELLLTETGGKWGPPTPTSLPANAASNPGGVLGSISCVSAGDCVAGGSYTDASGNSQGLLLTETDGVWATGVEAMPPTDSASNPGINGLAVSCALGADNCAAVGSYDDSSGNTAALLINATTAGPTLSLAAPTTGIAGSTVAASSVSGALSGGDAPTGTVTFTVFGPQPSPPISCGPGGTGAGSANASGDGTYHPSAGFTPTSAGDYWWYASYAGDASDNPAASPCGPLMPETTVTGQPSSAAPASSGPPTISGTTVAGRTLMEAHGSWSNNPTGYSYQWERCNRAVSSCATITGARGQTYKLTPLDLGHRIRVQETASNAAGSTPAISAPTAVVSPADRVLASHARSHGATLHVRLRCLGLHGTRCVVTLTLSVTESIRHHEVVSVDARTPGKAKHKVMRLARREFALRAGTARKVTLSLNRAGYRLLDTRHKLKVRLTISQKGNPAADQTITLRS